VFAKRGYRAASVDEVAAQAGFSKGAVYWHFGSKEDLLHAVIDERTGARTQALLDRMVEGPPDEDMGAEVGRRYMDMLGEERDLVLLLHEYWSLAARDPKLRKRFARREATRRADLARALRIRQEHMGTPDLEMPSEESATAFLALANGLAMQKLIDPESVPDHLYGEILGLTYEGLVAREEAKRRPRR
jgi:AcrR family transcriptional regulator